MKKSEATPSQLWLEHVYDSDLSGYHKSICAYLCSVMYGHKITCFKSAPTITKNVGWSERKVRDLINELIDQKWLKVDGLHRSGTRILKGVTPAQCATPAQHAPARDAPLHSVLDPPAPRATESVTESVSTISTVKRFIPPDLEELTAYCLEKKYTFDPETFIAHYETNGWIVGRTKMKSWKAACITWQKRERPNAKSNGHIRQPQNSGRVSTKDARQQQREREQSRAGGDTL